MVISHNPLKSRRQTGPQKSHPDYIVPQTHTASLIDCYSRAFYTAYNSIVDIRFEWETGGQEKTTIDFFRPHKISLPRVTDPSPVNISLLSNTSPPSTNISPLVVLSELKSISYHILKLNLKPVYEKHIVIHTAVADLETNE